MMNLRVCTLALLTSCYAALSLALAYPPIAHADSSTARPVVVVDIQGTINPATADLLKSALHRAAESNARLLVVRLDTPGGLLTSTKSMVTELLEAKTPVVVYVHPSGGGAISAGTFISLAGHFTYMAPGTNIGAAHPVLSSGGDLQGDMRTKVENYAVSLAKAIAEKRNRNSEWMEKAVRESITATAQEAVELNVINGMASNLDRLLTLLEGQSCNVDGKVVSLRELSHAPQIQHKTSLRQYVLGVLCDPNVAILLGLGAMIGIILELMNPGLFLPGIVGVICLVLSLTAAQSLPITYGGVALLLLAVIFFTVEAVVPSFGIWGIAGIVSLIIGSIYFVDQAMIWSAADFTADLAIYFACALFGLLVAFEVLVFLSDPKKRFQRKAPALVSKTGTVQKVFLGAQESHAYGKVEINGQSYDADFLRESDETIEVGQSVQVIEVNMEKNTLKVRPV